MTELFSFKSTLHQQLLNGINEKIASFETALEALRESISNETKSTAGDKYETARAMLHIEQENVGRQLANAHKQRNELLAIEQVGSTARVIPGSLVRTNNGFFYISIGHGKMMIANNVFIALSAISPLGKVLLGSAINEVVTFNAIQYLIIEIA